MALVDDDQIEKSRREFAEKFLAFLRAGDCLIQAQIDFIGGIDAAFAVKGGPELDFGAVFAFDGLSTSAELCHRRAERPEIIHHRLIDEDIAIREEENAFLAFLLSISAR